MGSRKMEDSDICPVDYHVKSTLMIDSIKLAKKKFNTVQETHDFGCLHRIHPIGSNEDMFELINLLR
jgi:hypothetical protein